MAQTLRQRAHEPTLRPPVAAMRQAMTFYRFVAVHEPAVVQQQLLDLGQSCGVRGTILVAQEGVNGTLVGSAADLKTMREGLEHHCGEMPFKYSDIDDDNGGFYRFKVKLKNEIVTFGVPDLDVADNGEHVDAERWNELLADPDVLVIDTRNQYEIDIGTFPGSVTPETENFRDFPAWVASELDPKAQPRIAMFCTGGIRCEKASAFMKQQGFAEVYQLDGGILKYLEEVPEETNRWSGECFVFDQRVSVDRQLQQGQYHQCYACRHPVSEADMQHPAYEEGVSCPHCMADLEGADRERFRERQRQVELAQQRGQQHIGTAQKAAPKAEGT